MNQSVPPPPPAAGPSYSPPAASGKQGLPIWAWIGIGCGCLVVLAIVAFGGLMFFGGKKALEFAEEMEKNPAAAVELMVKLNPEIELVESDPEAGKITIRNKKTGEVATFDFSDIESGNFSFEGADGSKFSTRGEEGKVEITASDGEVSTFGAGQDLDDIPSWVHLYPGAEAEVGFTQKGGGQATGVVSQTTDDSVQEVADHFETYFESQGWETTRNQMSGGGQKVIVVTGRSTDGTYTQNGTASDDGTGKTQIALQYSGPSGD